MTNPTATSIYNNMHTKVMRIMEEWQSKDKTTLLGRLMMYEAMLHWVWLVFVTITMGRFQPFVHHRHLLFMLMVCTIFVPIIWVMTNQLTAVRHARNDSARVLRHQIAIMMAYSLYICLFMMMVGQDSFFTGVSLGSGILMCLLLTNRQVVWWAFVGQSILISTMMVVPYWLGELPSLKRLVSHAAYAQTGDVAQQATLIEQSYLFWRMSYLYFSLPKLVVIVYTISKLLDGIEARKAMIRYKAEFDELTGLRNRRSLFDVARRNLCHKDSTNDHSVLLIDLDHFKQVNDIYGHLVGDKVLKEVADILKISLPEKAIAGRYGGEEFMVLLPNTPQHHAVSIANEARVTLASMPIETGDGRTVAMTASFGVATMHISSAHLIRQSYQQISSDKRLKEQFKRELMDVINLLIKHADDALYQAKYFGRNRVIASSVIYPAKIKHLLPANNQPEKQSLEMVSVK